jgi:hypothetical protein
MCDYSLHGIRSRLAEEGETLVIHRFCTGSKGLTSSEYLKPTESAKGFMAILRRMFASKSKECAVCIPDGAKLVLCGISSALQQALDLSTSETVTFRQLSSDAAIRDAVEFQSGVKVRLQELDEGQNVEVLVLSSEEARVHVGKLISAHERFGTRT